jgi:hypothetical protein
VQAVQVQGFPWSEVDRYIFNGDNSGGKQALVLRQQDFALKEGVYCELGGRWP